MPLDECPNILKKSISNSHTSHNDLELKQARDEATSACNRLLSVLKRKRQAADTDSEDFSELSQVLATLAEEVQCQDSKAKRRKLQESEEAASAHASSSHAGITANLASCTLHTSYKSG